MVTVSKRRGLEYNPFKLKNVKRPRGEPARKHPIEAVILAAGLGTRMKSDLPKVLHEACGMPMLEILLGELAAAAAAPDAPFELQRFHIVVGHGKHLVMDRVRALQESVRLPIPVLFTVQEPQLGTGHAVRCAVESPEARRDAIATMAVLNGDLPLFTRDAFLALLRAHAGAGSAASLASTLPPDPGAYGRVIREGGAFARVVEWKDATASQRRVREINGGVYVFERGVLEEALRAQTNRNAQGEFYLPDVFAFARKRRGGILAHRFEDPDLLRGVNNMKELADAQKLLYARSAERWMAEGVFLHDPQTTRICPRASFGRGVSIGPFTEITGDTTIGSYVRVGAHCRLESVIVGDRAVIRESTCAERAAIGADCVVGPMAHLRPGTRLGDHVRVGNFVEIKESSIGSRTNAAHLSYIGDAEIGSNVNVGCGFITCNYDGVVREGRRKHRTRIGDNSFVGSDVQVVAPIEIADGSYIASGSTVSEPVSERDSLVIARSRQVTKPGYAKKYRP